MMDHDLCSRFGNSHTCEASPGLRFGLGSYHVPTVEVEVGRVRPQQRRTHMLHEMYVIYHICNAKESHDNSQRIVHRWSLLRRCRLV